ncbi:hypothetical protein CEXT_470751 [Caerostris extrusa]|uniref:Uncharacterized protein n=1 Tax=Caerostris extrusa TaxID=172846 RepID=A0AAV4WVM6_CAEEX|nr:hypothetical protein CEXT_470751 [Caerostris extrusa]
MSFLPSVTSAYVFHLHNDPSGRTFCVAKFYTGHLSILAQADIHGLHLNLSIHDPDKHHHYCLHQNSPCGVDQTETLL